MSSTLESFFDDAVIAATGHIDHLTAQLAAVPAGTPAWVAKFDQVQVKLTRLIYVRDFYKKLLEAGPRAADRLVAFERNLLARLTLGGGLASVSNQCEMSALAEVVAATRRHLGTA